MLTNRSKVATTVGLLVLVAVGLWAVFRPQQQSTLKPLTEELPSPPLDQDFTQIQGGSLEWACPEECTNDCGPTKRQPSQIQISPFEMGRHEVRQSQWTAVMKTNPSQFKGGARPVESVTWNDIQKFIESLNSKPGYRYRLPSGPEWEYAARAGKKGDASSVDTAWSIANSYYETHEVGTKRPNAWGLFDMRGNVAEWTADSCVMKGPTDKPDSLLVFGIVRGGSWFSSFSESGSRSHEFVTRGTHNGGLGFRLVRERT